MPITFEPGVTKNKYYVYVLMNPFNDSIFYVGYTGNLDNRFRSHKNQYSATKEGQARWELISLIHATGRELTMRVIKSYPYRGMAMRFESAMIKQAYERNEPLLNYSSKDIQVNLSRHTQIVQYFTETIIVSDT
jgi:predicted GIY-YIG superfamily endonuclease